MSESWVYTTHSEIVGELDGNLKSIIDAIKLLSDGALSAKQKSL